jgi:ABC-type uncharacterized transport system permease subunit
MFLPTLIAVTTIGIYLLLSVILLWRLIGNRLTKPAKTPLLILGFVAIALHALTLRQNLYGGIALDVSFFTAFSLIAWLMALLMLIAATREPVENLGIGILPIAALAMLLRLLNSQQHSLTNTLSAGLEFHIMASVIAYSLLTIAALQAIMLYIQDAQIHNKHPGGFVRALPPLETMERLLFRLLSLGFIVLSVSLISGGFYVNNLLEQHLVHKFVLSVSAWILFGTLLWGRRRFGWRGRIAIRWTLAGFILLLLAYFGSKIVIEIILNR